MKKILLIFSLYLIVVPLYSQVQPNHQMKIYTSETGKIYVNKHLPIYLWMSTSPDENSKKIRLISEDSKDYTNPLYFDTEGYNTVRTPSKVDTVTKKTIYPIEDIIFEVYSDGLPPHTKHKFESSKPFHVGSKSIIKEGTKIILNAYDAVSGVEKIYYSINGAAYIEYVNPITTEKTGEFQLKYYSVDNVGNVEPVKELNFAVDPQAPKTSFFVEGDNSDGVISGRSKIELKSEDDFAGIKTLKYKIDNGKFQDYTYKIYAQYLSEGEHTITFFAEDNVGNTEIEQTKTIYVDKTPPVIIDEILGDSYIIGGKEFISGRAKMKLTAIDNKAGIQNIFYTTDGIEYNKYTEPFYLPSKKGDAQIKFYALDNVNNKSVNTGSQTSTGRNSYMDLTGPNLYHKFQGKIFTIHDTTYISPDTKIILSAWDSEAGANKIMYKINNGSEQEYSSPISISEAGKNSIIVTGYDNVNNTNTETFDVFVDNKGPEIFYRFSSPKLKTVDAIDEYPYHLSLFISATDETAGFEKITYSINETPFKIYEGYIKELKKNQIYNMKIKAYDKIGNQTETQIKFKTSQ